MYCYNRLLLYTNIRNFSIYSFRHYIRPWQNTQIYTIYIYNIYEYIYRFIQPTMLLIWKHLLYLLSRWTRVNLNSNRTDPLYRSKWRVASTGPTHPMPTWLKLWRRGQTFYSTQPIIGLFDLPHSLSLVCYTPCPAQCTHKYINIFIYWLYPPALHSAHTNI